MSATLSLPVCRWRGPLMAPDVFRCRSAKVVAPQGVSAEVCRGCVLADHEPPQPDGPCRFLGAEKGLRECPACEGTVRLKVFACAHPAHGETTLRECQGCPDRVNEVK